MRYELGRMHGFFRRKRLMVFTVFLVALVIIVSGIIIYDSLVSENALESLKYAALTEVGEYMNLSVADFFEKNPEFASEIMTDSNDGGTYTANSVLLENAEDEIFSALNSHLTKNDVIRLKVPIGTLTKNKYLSGKGFKVAVSAYTVSAIKCEIEWNVVSGGINQTMYTATLTMKVDVQIIFGSLRDSVSCETRKNLFTKIVVGEVPLGNNQGEY